MGKTYYYQKNNMIAWSEDYNTGNERIDFEHQIFFGLVNDFQVARLRNDSKDKLVRILHEISLYAKFHFKSEENIMEDIAYPELEPHRQHHYKLIESLSNKMMGLELGQHSAAEIEEFLLHWFTQHVTLEDSKIASYLKSAAVAGHEREGS